MFLCYIDRDKMATKKHWELYAGVGGRLRALRNQAGLSQAALGAKLGRSASAIDRYEMGERRLSLADLIRVSKILGVSPEALFQETPGRGHSGRHARRPAGASVAGGAADPGLLSGARLRAEHLRLLRELDRRLAYPAPANRAGTVREERGRYGGRRSRTGISPDAYVAALSTEQLRALARRAGWIGQTSPDVLRRFAGLILLAYARWNGREGR